MFSPQPGLHIRSLSPTTTEFTVSTRPSASLLSNVATAITFVVRLSLMLLAVLFVASRHELVDFQLPVLEPLYLYSGGLAILYVVLQRRYTEESLLVIRSLGVQISTTSGTWIGGGRKTRFIPTTKVRDILIHEGFWGFEVKFYLAVVVEDEGELVVVFPVRITA